MVFGEYLKSLRKEKSLSQRELAEKSGISNAEISRIETGNRKKPSPDVLRALAPILNVPYEELMDKAGYINDRSAFMTERRDAEEAFFITITPKLIIDGWGIEPLRRTPSIGDIVAKKDGEEWHIDFKFFRTRNDDDRHFRNDMMARDIATRVYGRLAIYDKSPITRFTLAVNDEKIFDIIKRFPPIHLDIKVSLMLINLDEGIIIKEEKLY